MTKPKDLPKRKIKDFALAFIDLETTGLDPQVHEIIQVAVRLVDPITLRGFKEFDFKVKPEHIETADPIALEVNGYTEEAWVDAYPLSYIMEHLNLLLSECIPAGQNTAFDLSFLYAACKRFNIKPSWERRYLDLMTLSYQVLKDMDITSLSLESVCEKLGISNDGAHDAMVDVDRTHRAWVKLTKLLDS